MNKLAKFEHLDHLFGVLKELWLNWNNIANSEANRAYLAQMTVLQSLYLADNPLANQQDYYKIVTEAIPKLQQLDGNVIGRGLKFYHQQTEGIHPTSALKSQNPAVAQLINSVLPRPAQQ
jgi:hypothetical protein